MPRSRGEWLEPADRGGILRPLVLRWALARGNGTWLWGTGDALEAESELTEKRNAQGWEPTAGGGSDDGMRVCAGERGRERRGEERKRTRRKKDGWMR